MLRTMNLIAAMVLLVLAARPAVADEPGAAPELRQALLKLDAMRNGASTPFAEVEEQGRELLAKYRKPEEQARIYFQLAHVYGQSNIRLHADKVTKYARLALKAERDPGRRGWLHTYLGDAAWIDSRTRPAFEDRRRAAAEAYLKGYQELLPLKLPEQAPELPAVNVVRNVEGEDPAEAEATRREHAAQMKARKEAEFVREMVHRRHVLIGQIAQLYRRPPRAYPELQRLAEQVLKERPAVDEFMRRVIRWKGVWENSSDT